MSTSTSTPIPSPVPLAKYPLLLQAAAQYPLQSEVLSQVFFDLALAKEFLEIDLVPLPSFGRYLIDATHPDTAERHFFLPTRQSEHWTLDRFVELFEAFDQDIVTKLTDGSSSKRKNNEVAEGNGGNVNTAAEVPAVPAVPVVPAVPAAPAAATVVKPYSCITLATVSPDSTFVYIKLHRGIAAHSPVPPLLS